MANSGTPFNITLGQDLNGDSIFNDRPAFASAPSTTTVATKWGLLDTAPTAGKAVIPINYATGPGQFTLNLRLSKAVGWGKKSSAPSSGTESRPDAAAHPGGSGGGDTRVPVPGGPGGLGPGGLSGSGGRSGPGTGSDARSYRYRMAFSASVRDVLNNVNLAPPVGNLSSPQFGKSIALAGGVFGNSVANRRIDLQMSFSF